MATPRIYCVFAVFAALWALPAAAQEPQLLDRILAVVDEDPILASDVERVIGLDLVEKRPDETEEVFHRRVLDGLIEEKLRFHEIDRFGFTEIPVEAVEDQFAAIKARFGSERRFRERLEQIGLDEDGLRQLVARQLMVLIYVEERLGSRVFVGLEEITAYYQDVLTPELRSRGERVPPIAEVREQIRAVLRESRLNEEIERWTEELRLEADIVDNFDRLHDELPPVVVE